MRRRLPLIAVIAALAAIALGAAGCGTDDSTPVACLNGSGAYLRALERAPGEVALAGGVPISSCLAENQKAGDLTVVGESLLGSATELNAEARKHPGGPENLQLGYLIGAARAGAEDTGGIHAELIRRLTAAATYSRNHQILAKKFDKAYREGFEAGVASG